MGTVRFDNLKAGMVLAQDLKLNGRMLLPAGAALEEKHLKMLKAWGIAQVEVEGGGEEAPCTEPIKEIGPEDLSRSEEYLRPFFASANLKHEAMGELFRLVTERTARKFSNGWTPSKPPQWDLIEAQIRAKSPIPAKLPNSAADLLVGTVQLASLPEVYTQIIEVLNSPTSTAAHLAEMVEKDSSLSTRLLKLVNSVFYGLPSKVDSISRAITLIGSSQLTSMAMGISVVKAFGKIPQELINMEAFWKHSISCGIYARLIGAHKVGLSAEQLFIGGLLHDIGRLIMLKKVPLHCLQAMRLAHQEQIPLFEAETAVLGFDHATVGSLLCKEWMLSTSLEKMVGVHHQPALDRFSLLPSIIHLANIMAQVFGPDPFAEFFIPPIQKEAWESIDLPPRVLGPMVIDAERQVAEVVQIFMA